MSRIQAKYAICTCGHTRHNHSDKPYRHAQTGLPMHPCRVAECICQSFQRAQFAKVWDGKNAGDGTYERGE